MQLHSLSRQITMWHHLTIFYCISPNYIIILLLSQSNLDISASLKFKVQEIEIQLLVSGTSNAKWDDLWPARSSHQQSEMIGTFKNHVQILIREPESNFNRIEIILFVSHIFIGSVSFLNNLIISFIFKHYTIFFVRYHFYELIFITK